jgi:cysteine synthase
MNKGTRAMGNGRHILDAIGNTPLVELRRIVPDGSARIVAKLESANPTGSMKDRLARMIVQRAAAAGRLPPGGTVVEYTAGTTGISLALVASALGYKTHFAFSDAFSDEKRFAMLAYGAIDHRRAQRQQEDHQGADSGDDRQGRSDQSAARPLVGRSAEQHRRG